MKNEGYNEYGVVGTYSTSDFLETCFLLASDMRLRHAVSENNYSSRVIFAFEEGDKCRELVGRLTLGNDMISASRFMDATRRARKIIVSCQNTGKA